MKRKFPIGARYILQNRRKNFSSRGNANPAVDHDRQGHDACVSPTMKETELYQLRKENIRVNLRMKAAKVADQKVITYLRIISFAAAVGFIVMAVCLNSLAWGSPAVVAIVGSLWKKGP